MKRSTPVLLGGIALAAAPAVAVVARPFARSFRRFESLSDAVLLMAPLSLLGFWALAALFAAFKRRGEPKGNRKAIRIAQAAAWLAPAVFTAYVCLVVLSLDRTSPSERVAAAYAALGTLASAFLVSLTGYVAVEAWSNEERRPLRRVLEIEMLCAFLLGMSQFVTPLNVFAHL